MLTLQTFEEAVAINNSVGQGLSSSLFTLNPELIFKWIGYVLMEVLVLCNIEPMRSI